MRIASALNKIIQNTRFKKKVSLEEMKAHKEDRFLRGRQIAYLICEYFRVTGANDSVENYADLFTVVLRNDDTLEFGSKWDEILLWMTQIPSDDTLESLYKLRYDSLTNSRPYWNCTISNGQCSKGDNCCFRHDKDKRANSTQANPSPRSSTKQSVTNASRTMSPRGRSPSGKMARLPCKDFCKKWHPSRMLVLQVRKWMRISGC